MRAFRKLVVVLFCLISLTGALVSAFYLAVNIKEIPGKIANLEEEEDGLSGLQTIESNINMEAILKAVQFFENISLDLSAVTPLIIFWFFVSLFLKSMNILVKSFKDEDALKMVLERAQNNSAFPFPRNYDTTWVQLGFIGTLWGFLIIGMRMEEAKGGVSPDVLDILLKAFGTALLSTFTAVVMVYVFCPIVKKLFRWAINVPPEEFARIPEQISEKLAKLSKELSSTAGAVKKLNGNIVKLEKDIDRVRPKILVEELKGIKSEISKFRKEMQAAQEIAEEELTKYNEINKHLSNIYKVFEPLTQRLALRIDKFENTIAAFKQTLLKSLKAGAEYTKEVIDTDTRPFIKSVFESESRQVLRKFDDTIDKNSANLSTGLKNIDEQLEKANVNITSNFTELSDGMNGVRETVETIHLRVVDILRNPAKTNFNSEKSNIAYHQSNPKGKKRFNFLRKFFRPNSKNRP